MGCTSSAQKITTSAANSPEKNLQISEDMVEGSKVEEIIYTKDVNEGHKINVLPTCDTLHLVSNKRSFGEMSCLRTEGFHENKQLTQENKDVSEESVSEEVKPEEPICTLEDAVEKVVELYATSHTPNHGKASIIDEETIDNESEHLYESAETMEDLVLEQAEDDSEKISSPSQSESSKATRWEALADIAAELPPSLAVDPVTGQIYALSK